MLSKVKAYWDWVQSLFDIDGDVIMMLFSFAIIWKILHHGLNVSDAAAYSAAIGAFSYSNKGKQ